MTTVLMETRDQCLREVTQQLFPVPAPLRRIEQAVAADRYGDLRSAMELQPLYDFDECLQEISTWVAENVPADVKFRWHDQQVYLGRANLVYYLFTPCVAELVKCPA